MPPFAKAAEVWNRRLHYFLGLYFLFFLWLFSLTGLMLNHQQWFTDLYDRHEVSYDPSIETPAGETRTEQTLDLMRQLNLRGEVDWPASQPVGHIDFDVARPESSRPGARRPEREAGLRQGVQEHLITRVPDLSHVQWHAIQSTSQRARLARSRARGCSPWTRSQRVSSVMVIGSYYMWWRLKQRRTLGVITLALGYAICGAFVLGAL